MVTDSEYKLPLFQKRTWLTLLSRVWYPPFWNRKPRVSLISIHTRTWLHFTCLTLLILLLFVLQWTDLWDI